MSTVESFKVDVSSVSPLSERMEELWVVCVCVYMQKIELRFGGIMKREHKNKSVEWKALVDVVGIGSANLKDKFLF